VTLRGERAAVVLSMKDDDALLAAPFLPVTDQVTVEWDASPSSQAAMQTG
jgi:hypothetical protein